MRLIFPMAKHVLFMVIPVIIQMLCRFVKGRMSRFFATRKYQWLKNARVITKQLYPIGSNRINDESIIRLLDLRAILSPKNQQADAITTMIPNPPTPANTLSLRAIATAIGKASIQKPSSTTSAVIPATIPPILLGYFVSCCIWQVHSPCFFRISSITRM